MVGRSVYISEREKELIIKALDNLELTAEEQKIKQNLVRKLKMYDTRLRMCQL